MEPELQMQFENNHAAYDISIALNDMFQVEARIERFQVSKAFVDCKLAEGTTVGPHVIKMVGYTRRLEKLGFPIGQELATDFILSSLLPSYGNFISNYHMHGAEKGLNELCGILKTAEADIKKSAGSSEVLAVQNKPNFKRKKGNTWKKKKASLRMRSISQTHLHLRLAQMLMLSAFTVRGKVTGRETASCTWRP